MSGIRSRVGALFPLRSGGSIYSFRSWLLWKAIFKPQDIACRLTLVGAWIMTAHAVY